MNELLQWAFCTYIVAFLLFGGSIIFWTASINIVIIRSAHKLHNPSVTFYLPIIRNAINMPIFTMPS